MIKFRGISAGLTAIGEILQNAGVFLKITLIWALILTGIVVAQVFYLVSINGGTLSEGIKALNSLANLRAQIALNAIPSLLASLATAILWTRFVVTGARPDGWLKIPRGSARYFGRSLIIEFGAILGLVPGLIAARIVSEYVPPAYVPFVGPTVIGVDVLVVLYICIRLWLIFPAIAVGDQSISFTRSFSLMRGKVFQFILAMAIVCLTLGIAIILISIIVIVIPTSIPLFIATQILSSLVVLAGTAASAGVIARAYKILVIETQKNKRGG